MTGYKDYEKKLKASLEISPLWEKLKYERHLSLLIGSGVTSCIVGDWNALLNEIAMVRYWSENKEIDPIIMRNYIKGFCRGNFLPNETDPIEKGEYLQYDPRDFVSFETETLNNNWREVTFSHQVLIAIERLMNRKLRDGTYKHPNPYTLENRCEIDFINWLKDEPEPIFGIGRRMLNDPDKVKEALRGLSNKAIAQKLSSALGVSIDLNAMKKAIQDEPEPYEQVMVSLGSFVDNYLEIEIKAILKKAKDPKEDMDEWIGEFLRLITAYAIWLPPYDTLEALLRLCMRGRITEVISYNFDMVFDRLLASRNVQEALKATEKYKHRIEERDVCVYGMYSLQPIEMNGFASIPTAKTIRIYHVHGILDRELKKIEPIIFSETAYKSYQELPFNIEKTYLANAYLQGGLLCVGFSGKDGAFRRIFDQMLSLQHGVIFGEGEGRNQIYLTRKLKDIQKPYRFYIDTMDKDLKTAYACVDTNLKMLQHYYRRQVHANILWSETYEEMAASLMEL